MNELDIDSILKTEENRIRVLLKLSTPSEMKANQKELVVCQNCGKDRKTLHDRDMTGWNTNAIEDDVFYFKDMSRCNCSSKQDLQKKYDNMKGKRKGVYDTMKNEQNGGKNFIAHNIKTCNNYRFRESYVTKDVNGFVHYKNSSDYISQYRSCKLEKIEKSPYQLDQAILNEEMNRSLSNSLTSLIGKIKVDEKPMISMTDDVTSNKKDLKMKDLTEEGVNTKASNSDIETSQHKRNLPLQANEQCYRCGDKLRDKESFSSIPSTLRFDQKFPFRINNHEKVEERKVKKLLKRTPDHRPRLIIEKSASVINRPELEQSIGNELQPFCQQMPLKSSVLIEKRSSFKRDDWRGHPSSSKPRFSEGLSRMPEESRRNRASAMRSSSLENVDIFSCYGEKYRMLKEST